MKVSVTTRNATVEIDLDDVDDFASISVDGKELIGIFADSGAGWYPHGDGGEIFGDWTPLVAKDVPPQCSDCGKPATREIFPELDDDPGSTLHCDDCRPATVGDIRPLDPSGG
jgi:hypothetical protein